MKAYWKITLAYLTFGIGWIVFTDLLAHSLALEKNRMVHLQMLKGWAFVAASSTVIFLLTKRAFVRQQAQEAEKLAIFRKTVEGSHHILLNFLNQMQLVTLEAERSSDFDQGIMELARNISDEAATALHQLQAVEQVNSESIHTALYDGERSSPDAR